MVKKSNKKDKAGEGGKDITGISPNEINDPAFMSEIQMFNYSNQNVRVIYIDGEIWFVANDIGSILTLTDTRKSVKLLDRDDRNTVPVMDALGRYQDSTIINESGLYNLIFQSRKPEAKRFKRWVTSEVLPSIRKTGKYEVKGLKNLSEEEKRSVLREEIKIHNKALAQEAQKSGVGSTGDPKKDSIEYAVFQNPGYKGLYGGLTSKDIHTRKELKKNQKILDHMGSEELAANFFRVTQTEAKLKRENIQTSKEANNVHFEMGHKVRRFILDEGGTPPEELPVYNKVKSIKRMSQKMEIESKEKVIKRLCVDISNDLWKIALWLMCEKPAGIITTKELREEIPKRITIDKKYLEISKIKQEAKIEQVIRNLKSNKKNKTNFINQGYAIDIRGGFQITKKGLEFVKEEFKEFL